MYTVSEKQYQLSECFQISFDMDIYIFFLAMSILKVSDAVFRFQCPVQSHWTHRAGTICGSKSSYFCLYDINENNFTEFCRKNPDFEKPGKKLSVAGSTQGTLQGSNCSNDFYQPLKFWTNESHSCVLAKSYCNEEGQVVYRNETNKVDRSCRCDYTRGYDFIIRPKHRCYCVPSEEDCSCHLKICPSNYNFSQDYECLQVTERNTSFYCESIHSVVLPKDSEISLSTNNSSLESYVLAIANIQLVHVLVLISVLIVAVYISCILNSIKADPETQSLPANMQNIDNVTGDQSVSGASPQLPGQTTEDSQANDSSNDEDNGQGGAGDHNSTGSGLMVTSDQTMYARCRFVLDDVLTRIMREYMEQSALPWASIERSIMNNKPFKDHLSQTEMSIIQTLPTEGFKHFEISLMYKVARNKRFSMLIPDKPTRDWGSNPQPNEATIGDNMERIRICRNKFSHMAYPSLQEKEFNNLFTTFIDIAKRAKEHLKTENFEDSILHYKTCSLDKDMEKKYIQQIKSLKKLLDTVLNTNLRLKVYIDQLSQATVEDIRHKGTAEGVMKSTITVTGIENAQEKAELLNSRKRELATESMVFNYADEGSLLIYVDITTSLFQNQNLLCRQIKQFMQLVFEVADLQCSTGECNAFLSILEENYDTASEGDNSSFDESCSSTNNLVLHVEVKEEAMMTDELLSQNVHDFLGNVVTKMNGTPITQGEEITATIGVEETELQEILQYWRNKLQRFVVTKAVELVYERIQTKQVVAIIGPTGTGKSVYAYKVAFRLSEEHGYKIIPAKQPADITRYFEKGAKQVFVIDDIVGKYDFNEAELVSWETLLHNVLNNNEQIKVLLTGRKSIWHPGNCERLKIAFVCDLNSEELRLTPKDRLNICEAYLESSDINALLVNDKMINMYPFLPSICSTYLSEDVGTVEDFFTYPIQIIEEQIDNYKMKSPVLYTSLAVLAFEENIAKNLSFVNIEKLMKSLLLEFGSQILPSKGLIVSQLEALTDTYVKIDNDCFEFIHVEMKTIVLYCVAKTFMTYVLKYSKMTVIRNQVTLAGITCIRKEQTLPVIKVTPEHEEAYFTRLAGDLIEGQVNCFDILENNQNDFPIFREQFLVFLNSKKRYIKKRNAVGSTVLHVVSSLGYGDYVSYFINFDKGMINETDANGNVPLHLASMYGRLDIVELLAVNGRNIHMLNNEKISPFFYACEKNHISVVNYMIKLPDAVGNINKTYTSEHRTVLHIACLKGFTELTKILLNHHANVDVQDKSGLTPLHLACINGQRVTASLLLKFRANVNALDKLERTPMYYSCTANHKNIVELLIQNKADINRSSLNGFTPLHAACEEESIEIVKLLIEKGSNVDAKEKTGERPLHLACRTGNEQTVKLLIDNKASINVKTNNQMTPFHEACKHGHQNVVDILLKKNVKYNEKNNQGWTGLFFSCVNGNNGIVDMILNRKTDVNRIDKDGITALHLACTNSHRDIVSTLLKKKAKVNLPDIYGVTPLYISCLNNDIEIVKILCQNGADVKKYGNSGLNPITIAQEKGFSHILAELNKVKK